MKFLSLCKKNVWQLKLQLEALNDRDRGLLFGVSIFAVFFIWFLLFAHPVMNRNAESIIENAKLTEQIHELEQKKVAIDSAINFPNTQNLLKNYSEMEQKIKQFDFELTHYSEHYISKKDLAKLLHDMLKQTTGISIVGFVSVPPVISASQTSNDSQTPPPEPLAPTAINPVQYRLTITGTYFSVMSYLKRLEELPWNLYWDKFDYAVTKYPNGSVTVEFYTLKPLGEAEITAGSKGGAS